MDKNIMSLIHNSAFTTDYDLLQWANRRGLKINFIGFKDKLEKEPIQEGSYIINLANSTDPGTHWVGLYMKNRQAYYFDSFAIVPPKAVMRFIERYTSNYYSNNQQIQNINSGYCGQYVLLFLYTMDRSRNKLSAFRDYEKFFSTDLYS